MARKKGQIVAVRVSTRQLRKGPVEVYQLAYIPASDEDGFPAVISISPDLFDTFDGLRGQVVEFKSINVPPFNDEFVTEILSTSQAAD